jgi:carbamoyl-phosphate synthase/aspartate carbamoyltransferase/dihydroorotase
LDLALTAACQKSHCDYAQFLGAGPDNAAIAAKIASQTAGLKMYLDQTYGPLRLDDLTLWMAHFRNWPRALPIVAHAEGKTLAAVILMAALFERPVHLAHVSRRDEILLIRAAKEKGLKVTCEVTPHHLFLSKEDIPVLGQGLSEVRPGLAEAADRDALWQNLEVIDCFATDHAPHTLIEKDSTTPPPGYPGLETALPCYLELVRLNLISLDNLRARCYENPRRIFNLPVQTETWIEVDPEAEWTAHGARMHTRAQWTPFEGRTLRGRVIRVVLRGQTVFQDGQVLAAPGIGRNVRATK